jgi:hypothetical protein
MGESYLGILVYGGEDIPFHPVPVNDDRIQADEEASGFFLFEFGNSFSFKGVLAFPGDSGGFYRMVIKVSSFNHFLDFPGGYFFSICLPVKDGQLLLAVADMLFPENNDAQLLISIDLPLSFPFGSFIPGFQAFQLAGVIQFFPLMEGFPGYAEMAACSGDVLTFMMVIKPSEPKSGLRRELGQTGHPG